MKTIYSLLLSVALIAIADRCVVAQMPQLKRIGLLTLVPSRNGDLNLEHQPFLDTLRELGYIEGKTVLIDYGIANEEDNNLPDVAAELVRLKVSIIVAQGPPEISAAIKMTKTIPIVMVGGGNPVDRGFVTSLTRPGGNVTGLSSDAVGLRGKRLELFKEAFSSISRVAVLNPDYKRKGRTAGYESEAKVIGVDLQVVAVDSHRDLERAFSKIVTIRSDALIAVRHNLTRRYAAQIAEFAVKKRLPSMFESAEFVKVGGLMSYGVSHALLWRGAAAYVDKILKGANPATLPVEPPQLELVVNLATAKKLGVKIPPEILLEANEVIK